MCRDVLVDQAAKDNEKDSCNQAIITAHPSNEEFLTALPDGMSPEVAPQGRRIVARVSGWDVDEIQLGTRFVELCRVTKMDRFCGLRSFRIE